MKLCIYFSCVADNSLGRTKKYIEISGRPGPAEFISPTFSGSLEYYNLTWSVESIPPLEEIRLLYRRLMVHFFECQILMLRFLFANFSHFSLANLDEWNISTPRQMARHYFSTKFNSFEWKSFYNVTCYSWLGTEFGVRSNSSSKKSIWLEWGKNQLNKIKSSNTRTSKFDNCIKSIPLFLPPSFKISDIHQFYTKSHENHVDDMEYKMTAASSSPSLTSALFKTHNTKELLLICIYLIFTILRF